MMAPRPPQPPAVMLLIEQRRERLGISKRTAAAFAGLSEARWRQLVNGGRPFQGTWITESAPDPTLARMALAVRVAPEDIKPVSPLAAQILADLIAEREASGHQDEDDAARMVDALGGRKLTARQRLALENEIAEALRRLRD